MVFRLGLLLWWIVVGESKQRMTFLLLFVYGAHGYGNTAYEAAGNSFGYNRN
jgi:hypothetical protein